MNDVLQALHSLQTTHFAVWVNTSVYGYEIILSLHAVGLAFLVGIMMIIDLRILGLAKAVPLPALRPAMRIIWGALALQVVTGISLFSADAQRFFLNHMFRYKMSSIFVGVLLAVLINRSVLGARGEGGEAKPPATRAKVFAALSLAMWASAIIFGRLIAYYD